MSQDPAFHPNCRSDRQTTNLVSFSWTAGSVGIKFQSEDCDRVSPQPAPQASNKLPASSMTTRHRVFRLSRSIRLPKLSTRALSGCFYRQVPSARNVTYNVDRSLYIPHKISLIVETKRKKFSSPGPNAWSVFIFNVHPGVVVEILSQTRFSSGTA